MSSVPRYTEDQTGAGSSDIESSNLTLTEEAGIPALEQNIEPRQHE
jgi:hypothetical protein